MKEMTIEEKARRYDEAVERAKHLTSDFTTLQAIREFVFPELKESEDERIRKRLIECFEGYYDRFATDKNHVNVHWEGLEVKEVLAWLEKQGEQKQEWSEEDKQKMNRIYSILRQAADTHAFSTSCRLIGDKESVDLQDFLKSLKDRYTWLPSDEQLEALKIARDRNDKIGFYLSQLYDELKKLM